MKIYKMENQFDSESYWNRSTSIAFSFDDDDLNVNELGQNSSSAATNTKWDVNSSIFDDTVSEASFDNSASASTLNLSIKSIISDDALRVILQEQTLDDRTIPKRVTPEEELKLLRRQIQTTLYSPSAEATAYKLLLGKNVALEVFKSLHEKEQLLNVVLEQVGGGDAVIRVLLFLEKTLNHDIFHKILKQRPKALDHYLSYLQQRVDSRKLFELLKLFGRHQDLALLQFKSALTNNNMASRKQQLLQLNESYAANMSVVGLYQQMFHATYKLHELIEKQSSTLNGRVTMSSSPIEVLYACCSKNNNWKEQDLLRTISPQRVATEHQISSAQYEWTALNERAAVQAYADLECIFERVPTWHPMKTKQFHISFALESAIQRLAQLNAPTTVLYLFLSKMNNNNEKLEVAQRVHCMKAVIDALVSLKDVAQLTKLRDTLQERSEEQFLCDNALKSLQSKRWSTDNIKLKL